MNAFASASTTPLYIAAPRRQPLPSPYDYLAPAASPWAAHNNTVSYDTRGRLQPFVETSEQRRARAEFLRKREFSRRINAWIQDAAEGPASPALSRSSDTDSLRTIDEDDESEQEPEVIYSTSPCNARWAPASPPTNRPPSRHLRASSRTSSMSSLSSISEEDV
ncbi:hypothetical protein PsYK624_090320 [Phanerochaete sordida]|uniref:Uncharacterized protein n=1 Tax=Phanerochaete sordida TaxID=48140 RepID=A0A9P3LFQ4_9APHY|nr:hypothetical protein PsYK624_090320 [Phanerochaete sordida]